MSWALMVAWPPLLVLRYPWQSVMVLEVPWLCVLVLRVPWLYVQDLKVLMPPGPGPDYGMAMCPAPGDVLAAYPVPEGAMAVESSDTPKDLAAVPKCPPSCPEASPAEPLPNGDVEGDGGQWKGAEEAGASPKGGRPEEDETESLPDGETGRALENGRCTPKEGLDAPADEGELAPSDPQKKRGRRKLLEATEKNPWVALLPPSLWAGTCQAAGWSSSDQP
ncbi:dna (cytosine-5)-methyltransferase 3a [Limosa lapponica baueri]|uniref:Dna (Cytosine-5)-methyltransferase 3a n=1 Tax=Limosa lapponica baueri TaxID=1758121 RepID=A0A2I0T306_LIMLA|nr:dna (cytosine-5)-methyltransferase 3a [Limosa lapponica baueri]